MDIKRKLVSVVTLTLMGSSAFAAEAWSTSNLSSYSAGTIVTDEGKTYKCKPWPQSGWCKIAAYKPAGTYGADAWDETGPGPSPTPSEQVTASVSINGELPTTAEVDFVSSKGTFAVSNGKVTLEYPKDASETYTVKLKNDEGTISPSTVTVSAATTTIALTYTAKPAPEPTPGIKAWDPSAIYNGGDQVTYNGSIYEAKYWTQGNNPETSGEWGPWKLIGEDPAQEMATLDFTIPTKPSFITSDEKPSISIFNENDVKVAEIKNAAWGSKAKIDVPAGKLKVQVASIGTSQGIATPNSFSIAKDETKNISINYKQAQVGSINLTASADNNAVKSTTYTIKNSTGDVVSQGEVNFTSATVIDNLLASDEGLKYTISAKSFTYNGYSYEAQPIVVTVTTGNSADAQLNFTTTKIASVRVIVTVSDMPNDKETTLHFTSNSGSSQLLKVADNGVYTEELPKDGDTWNITADNISGYKANISPNQFNTNQNQQNVTVTFEQVAPVEAGKKVIGYWENWKPALPEMEGSGGDKSADYYKPSFANYSHVLYSFLTLSNQPNSDNPPNTNWDGSAIYETMTLKPVLEVMNDTTYSYNWQAGKIKAMIDATHQEGKKFIWAIGGWSDLQQTIKPEQIDSFVTQCVNLLKQYGDGIDFDWEHLHQLANGQPNPNAKEQTDTLAKTMLKLRQALDDAGMYDKEVGYTTRFNAFFGNSEDHAFPAKFNSDGEGLAIDGWLKDHGSSLNEVVNWVNIMAYDVGPEYMPNGQTWNMEVYKDVLNSFSKHVDPNLVILGFEPGGQAAGGIWEGMDVSKQAIDYVANNNYGGSMFWAINQPPYNSTEITGLNADKLAAYSKEQFGLDDE
ncbi:glycosyl hydrolase family 18 protein [Allofrancisella guangzhouensis]|uniref:glycosyl hydrolase family 18 protein n=2 Tax=Allofrancisella guangzhouensis TaxID=594679 RepID=UPI002D7EC880|nr:glycosyl hydrolase family 18 protein [Allofrancisella guangzhouensis]